MRGRAEGRVIYLGSCGTMVAPDQELQHLPRLLNRTYTGTVFFSLERDYPDLVRRLGFRMATAEKATARGVAAVAPA